MPMEPPPPCCCADQALSAGHVLSRHSSLLLKLKAMKMQFGLRPESEPSLTRRCSSRRTLSSVFLTRYWHEGIARWARKRAYTPTCASEV